MRAMLAAADALGEPTVALLGDPAYYRHWFGFVAGATLDYSRRSRSGGRHFQVCALAAWDDSLQGVFRYARAFGCLT